MSAAVAIDPEGTGSYYQVEVTITDTNGLTQEAVQSVTVAFVDASTETVLIAYDGSAPTKYTLTFATAADWVANGGGIATVTCT